MHNYPSCINKAIPEEYRDVAEALFPPEGYIKGEGPSLEQIQSFAEILGVGLDYKRLLSAANSGRNLGDLLLSFQNNLDLLIQKTWVEKADEIRKERLLDGLPDFIAGIAFNSTIIFS